MKTSYTSLHPCARANFKETSEKRMEETGRAKSRQKLLSPTAKCVMAL
jgi:hypothetical protein